MGSLLERVEAGSVPRLRDSGQPVAEILERLESAGVAGLAAVDAADLLACVAHAALGDAKVSPGPELIRQPPPRPRLERSCSEPALARLLPEAARNGRLALAAGLLQVHDFWEASHEAAQAADDLGERTFSAWWHGIAHRREPDPGNAAYWFRQVGRHPLFEAIARAARPILAEQGDDRWTRRVLGGDTWNPQAMIDLCTAARPGSFEEALARKFQRLEMQLLLDATAAAVAGTS